MTWPRDPYKIINPFDTVDAAQLNAFQTAVNTGQQGDIIYQFPFTGFSVSPGAFQDAYIGASGWISITSGSPVILKFPVPFMVGCRPETLTARAAATAGTTTADIVLVEVDSAGALNDRLSLTATPGALPAPGASTLTVTAGADYISVTEHQWYLEMRYVGSGAHTMSVASVELHYAKVA